MMRRFFTFRALAKWLSIAAVNLALCLVLFGVAEFGARYIERHLKEPIKEMKYQFHPYIMVTSSLPEDLRIEWHSPYVEGNFPSTLTPNNLGFFSDFDYTYTPSAEYLKKYGKQPGEKIILLTGGSAAQGVGASSNDATIAHRMQHYLNQAQRKVRYRVINLGMSSWISYQEYIALDLFGSQFDPDWIVIMDGNNDAAAVCQLASGPANPMFWPTMYYFLNGQTFRSPTRDALLQHSALVRLVTGKHFFKPMTSATYYYDPAEKDPRFRVKTHDTWSSIDKQLAFYLRTQTSILRLYQDAKYIVSSQPMATFGFSDLHHQLFTTHNAAEKARIKAELEPFLKALFESEKDKPCTRARNRSTHTYFVSKSAMALEQLANDARTRGWRDVEYENIFSLLPAEDEERIKYFMDIVHLNDAGQDLIGKFYAKRILDRDGFISEAAGL